MSASSGIEACHARTCALKEKPVQVDLVENGFVHKKARYARLDRSESDMKERLAIYVASTWNFLRISCKISPSSGV